MQDNENSEMLEIKIEDMESNYLIRGDDIPTFTQLALFVNELPLS